MSVIAYCDGVMAADGCSFSSTMRYRAMHPKVSRCAVGLIGSAGPSSDALLFHQWMASGAPDDAKPPISDDKDDRLHGLWARNDGSLWFTDRRLIFHEIEPLAAIGETVVCAFAEGVMRAGLGAITAVELAIKHCIYAGGAVQSERLARISVRSIA